MVEAEMIEVEVYAVNSSAEMLTLKVVAKLLLYISSSHAAQVVGT